MFRLLSMIFAAGVALFGATAAQAGTRWSVFINLPVPGVVVKNGGYYVSEPRPVYYAPAPSVRYVSRTCLQRAVCVCGTAIRLLQRAAGLRYSVSRSALPCVGWRPLLQIGAAS